MKSEQPKMIELHDNQLKEYDNAIIIISNGMAYVKELPNFGITEIHTRDGKVVKGDVKTSFKI